MQPVPCHRCCVMSECTYLLRSQITLPAATYAVRWACRHMGLLVLLSLIFSCNRRMSNTLGLAEAAGSGPRDLRDCGRLVTGEEVATRCLSSTPAPELPRHHNRVFRMIPSISPLIMWSQNGPIVLVLGGGLLRAVTVRLMRCFLDSGFEHDPAANRLPKYCGVIRRVSDASEASSWFRGTRRNLERVSRMRSCSVFGSCIAWERQ